MLKATHHAPIQSNLTTDDKTKSLTDIFLKTGYKAISKD